MYSHVDTNGGIVDCEWYSVLNILLNLSKAVKKNQIKLLLWRVHLFLADYRICINNVVKQNNLSCTKKKKVYSELDPKHYLL